MKDSANFLKSMKQVICKKLILTYFLFKVILIILEMHLKIVGEILLVPTDRLTYLGTGSTPLLPPVPVGTVPYLPSYI